METWLSQEYESNCMKTDSTGVKTRFADYSFRRPTRSTPYYKSTHKNSQ